MSRPAQFLVRCAAVVLAVCLSNALSAEDLPPVVFVPFDQTPTVDPKGQGVFLPYEKFIKLWDAANPVVPEVKPDVPPVPAALTGFTLTGSSHGDLAEFTLDVTVSGLVKGWSRVVLPSDLALADFKPSDKRMVLERAKDGIAVHLPEAGNYRFTAILAVPVLRDAAGKRSIAMVLPAAASGRLDLTLADTDADVALTPLVAATTTKSAAGTRLLAVLGGAGRLAITWQPPVQDVAGEALILAANDLRLGVAERRLRYDLVAQLTILRRPVSELKLTVPADTQVLAVEAKGLRSWEKTGTTVVLKLHEPVEGSMTAVLRAERALPGLAPGERQSIEVEWPVLVGAARVTGTVAVSQGEGVAVTVDRAEGFSQIDPAELTNAGDAVAVYRFLAPPPAAKITVTRLQPELRVGLHHLVRLGVDEDLIGVVVQLDVRKAGIFALVGDVPANWELVDTAGLVVDDVRLGAATAGRRRLDLALRNRLIGSGEIVLRFKAPPSIPREAKVGAASAAVDLGVLRLAEVRQARGTLAVAAPRSWALSTAERTGLTGAEVEQVRREGPLVTLARELKEGEDLPLAFTWLGSDASLKLGATPRARELILHHEELITVAEGHLRRLASWRGEVRYSAAAALRFLAPTVLDDKIIVKGANLAEHVAISRADGMTTWELRFQAPVLGALAFSVEATQELAVLTAGAPSKLVIAPLSVVEVTRLTSVVAVAREGTVEVSAEAAGLEPLPTADLPPGLQTQGVVAGFQGGASAALTATVVRHDLLALADAAVVAVRYDAVIGDDGLVRVRGDLLLSTRGRPYLGVILPAGAELLEVTVDRHPGRPSRRADGSVVVQLGEGAGLRSQRVSLVYEQHLLAKPASFTAIALSLPRLGTAQDGEQGARPLPVGHAALSLYLPESLAAYGWSGDFAPTRTAADLWSRLVGGGGDADERIVQEQSLQPNEGDNGLTVRVALVGRRHDLARLGDGGSLSVRVVERGVLTTMSLIAALLAAIATWLVRRRGEAVAAVAVGAVALVVGVAGAWFVVALGVALGVGAAALLLAVRAALAAWNSWRAACRAERAITPDPWLENAAPLPVTAPAPVTTEVPPSPPAPQPPTDSGENRP